MNSEVSHLIRSLEREQSFEKRCKLIKKLGKTRDIRAVNAIVVSLKGGAGPAFEYNNVLIEAHNALVTIGPQCINQLIHLLKTENNLEVLRALKKTLCHGLKWKPQNVIEKGHLLFAEGVTNAAIIQSLVIPLVPWGLDKLYVILFGRKKFLKNVKEVVPSLIEDLKDQKDEDSKREIVEILTRLMGSPNKGNGYENWKNHWKQLPENELQVGNILERISHTTPVQKNKELKTDLAPATQKECSECKTLNTTNAEECTQCGELLGLWCNNCGSLNGLLAETCAGCNSKM